MKPLDLIFMLMISVIFIGSIIYVSRGETGIGSLPPKHECGDGFCEAWIGENFMNCPQDCPTPQQVMARSQEFIPTTSTSGYDLIPKEEVRKMIDEKISEVRIEINNIKNEIADIRNETNSKINTTNELIEKRLSEIEKRISKIEELLKNIVRQLEFQKEVRIKLETKELACNLSNENEELVLNCSQNLRTKIENVNRVYLI
jgi:MoaA/NifB/PqqE/SkfB family radical SAM enzyme